jgi:hypothetical protein
MPDPIIKRLMDACQHMRFKVPISDFNAKWSGVDYAEYMTDPALLIMQEIYQKLIGFAALLIIGVRKEIEGKLIEDGLTKDSTTEQIEELIDKNAKEYQDFVCYYVRYSFYEAVATAQNAVVLSYFCDDWDTEELSELVEAIGDEAKAEPEISPVELAT